jgi:hypothetical protein
MKDRGFLFSASQRSQRLGVNEVLLRERLFQHRDAENAETQRRIRKSGNSTRLVLDLS